MNLPTSTVPAAETAKAVAQFYNDHNLGMNFIAITEGFKSVDKELEMAHQAFLKLRGRVDGLEKLVKASKRGRVKPLIVGVVVGVVAYHYIIENSDKIVKKVDDLLEDKNEGPKSS